MLDCGGPKIDICKKCHHASGKIKWCGLHGIWIQAPKTKKKYPSLIKQAGSFGKAVVDQVRAGNPKRSPERIAEIMRICNQCPSYVANAERCRKCGCRVPAKIRWATQSCPAGKW